MKVIIHALCVRACVYVVAFERVIYAYTVCMRACLAGTIIIVVDDAGAAHEKIG